MYFWIKQVIAPFMKFCLSVFLLIFLLTFESRAATCTAQASGNWTLASTWSCGAAPGCNDIIIVPSGFTVTITEAIDLTGTGCNNTKINIYGVVFFSGNASRLDLVATATINIYAGGKITTDQANNSQKITLGSGPSEWSSNNGNLTGPWTITNGNSGSNGTLPVQLIGFTGTCSGGDVVLDWSTATEVRNAHFTVEKSTDAINWQFVAQIQGNGTTSAIHHYSYTDAGWVNELSYYRLVQVDETLEETVLKPIDVHCNTISGNKLSIYPNPANTTFNVSVMHGSSEISGYIKIHNLIGELVLEQPVTLTNGSNSFSIPVELSNGAYNLEIGSENSTLLNQRLIILH